MNTIAKARKFEADIVTITHPGFGRLGPAAWLN